MTADIFDTRQRASSPWLIAEAFRREPLYAGAALCLAALAGPTLFAMALDQRTVLGVNVWIKPLRFEVALAVYLATLAWFAGWLPRSVVTAGWYRIFAVAVVLAIAAEMIWIGAAAAFGIASHFNESTPVLTWTYRIMGGLAVLLTSAALVYGILILRDQQSRLDPAFGLSVGIGLVLTFLLTVAVAGYMATSGSHFVGGNLSGAEGTPLMGWARDGGDLRVAHYFATHAMHFIPAFGFIASLLLSANAARLAIVVFSALFTALVGYAFAEALMGRPFLPALL